MHEKMQCLLGAAVSLPPLKDALCTETGAWLHKLAVVTIQSHKGRKVWLRYLQDQDFWHCRGIAENCQGGSVQMIPRFLFFRAHPCAHYSPPQPPNTGGLSGADDTLKRDSRSQFDSRTCVECSTECT